jgi:hypothetical protein
MRFLTQSISVSQVNSNCPTALAFFTELFARTQKSYFGTLDSIATFPPQAVSSCLSLDSYPTRLILLPVSAVVTEIVFSCVFQAPASNCHALS